MARLKPIYEHLLSISIAATLVGIVLIVLAEYGDIHETRIFGATLIVLGGLGIGTRTGLADPRALRVPGWLADWRVVIGVAAALLAIGPVLIALILATVGIFAGDRQFGGDLAVALGFAVVLLMAAALVAATALSIQRIVRAAHEPPSEMTTDEIIEGDAA